MITLDVAAWLLAVGLSVPLAVLAVECLAAFLPRRRGPAQDGSRPRLVVLIPAHDEGGNLTPTLRSVADQLAPGDRLLVVADNCTDDTAAVARAGGAEVVERTDPDRRGKGYALAFGREALRADPPAVVVVMDADVTLGPDALARLVPAATDRPAQAAYWLAAPAAAGPGVRVAAFAFLVKNVTRPTGLMRLGGHCLLTGTGMGFPWAVFRDAPLDHGHITEDMALTADLALAGTTVRFVPGAEVWGTFPADPTAVGSQRRRWEHGHLQLIIGVVPRLIRAGVVRGRAGLLLMALDLGVPPLSALVLATVAVLVVLLGYAAVAGTTGPAACLAGFAAVAGLALALVWCRDGRQVLPARSLIHIPGYVVGKLGLYLSFLFRPQRQWVRTERS